MTAPKDSLSVDSTDLPPANQVDAEPMQFLSRPTEKLRRVGIHGARGTGKTCYLACLYGHRATEKAAITFSDDHSIDHLLTAWKVLEHGDVPEANALVLPTELRMAIHANGIGWNIATRDYAGALVQRSETGVPELKQDVKEWLKSCHAILLFVNIDTRSDGLDSALKERQDELDLLLTELRGLSSDKNSIGRPLALLLTKWDVQGKLSGDLERERERALDYLRSRPALKQIRDALSNCGDRVEVFPVSAFGSQREGGKPPVGGPRPFGLHPPLIWAVQKTDEMLHESTKREATLCAGEGVSWWRRRYGKAVSLYRSLIQEHGVNKGPIYEQAQRELNTWRWKHFKRRLNQAAVSVTLLLLLSLWGAYWYESEAHQSALATLVDSSATPDQVKREVEGYLQKNWNPMGSWLGHKAEVDEKWKGYRINREEQEFSALANYRQANPEDDTAEKRLRRDREFRERWPGSSREPTVKGWESDDLAASDEFQRNSRLEAEYRTLEESLSKLGDKYEKLVAECDGFLKRFPEAQHLKRVALINDVKKKRTSFEQAKHEQEWAAVVNYDRQNPNNFDEIVRRAKDYSNKPMARYAKEARDLTSRTELRWDRHEYDKVRDAAREAHDADSIQAAEQAARRYLNGTHPLKKGERAVKMWVAWFEGFKQEKDYYFTIKSVSIPEGSDLYRGNNDTKVYGKFNAQSFDTDWGYNGNNPQIGKKMGPVRFQWGKGSSMEITVEKYRYVPRANRTASGKEENDRFLLRKLNGTFVVTCDEGKKIEIHLECPEAVPPVLATYPEK